MHHARVLIIATLALSACAGTAPSSSAPAAPAAPAVVPPTSAAASTASTALKAPGEAIVGDRTTCPTSGEEFTVTAASPKVEYKGKTYYFCCGGCDEKFAREPEKYLGKKPGA